MANPLTLFPGVGILPAGSHRVARPIEQPVVGGDHAALGGVEKHGHPACLGLNPLSHRPDAVGAHHALPSAKHLGMDRVVDEREDRRAVCLGRLDDIHPPVVEGRRIVVVGDPLGRLVGAHLEHSRLQCVIGSLQGLSGLLDHEVDVGQVCRVAFGHLGHGKGIAVGRAVGVGCANQDVFRRNVGHQFADAIAEHPGEAEEVEPHEGHAGVALPHHRGPGRQLPERLGGRVWRR